MTCRFSAALDAAGVLYDCGILDWACPQSGLTPIVAGYVETLITNPDVLGTDEERGRVNIHVNENDNYCQPNCNCFNPICNHAYAWEVLKRLFSGTTFTLSNGQRWSLNTALLGGSYYLNF